ncbi:MAG TPA: N-acetylneuraminate synthase family protein [Candidatus Methylacidiphilales bacterium]|nr:N-acetylneuraminate synthase family protein [Candidatus Methylacidiphilales bacterium]
MTETLPSPLAFPAHFAVGGREIGPGRPVFVIAEAGVNHFGQMDLAEQLLDLAISAKADAFKLQVFDVDQLFTAQAGAWKDRLRPRVLSFDEIARLRDRCRAAGLAFLLTTHDSSKIPWLEKLDVDAVKVGSGERDNTPFLAELAALRRPMIVSTGMHDAEAVKRTISACARAGAPALALLHCVTSYPTPEDQLNLAAMDELRSLFPGPVGYSDHTPDHAAVLYAVARGAQIIEKHITILRDVPNAQDWKVSAGPEDFGALVSAIRRVTTMLGSGKKEPAPCESAALSWATKSLVAARVIAAGETITAADLVAKRPGDGIPPHRLGEIVGRKAKVKLEPDQALAWENLE